MRSEVLAVRPVEAGMERVERITVCTRPFRAAGPRIEAERLGKKLLVHNYGHGGAGWSLSWGSAALAAELAMAGGAREVAVIGCGALGLTTAITLQRMGVAVRIYARDLPELTRSARATGTWTPDARVALVGGMEAGFAARWEGMVRVSMGRYRELMAEPGSPVAMHARWTLSELPPAEALAERVRADAIGFAHLEERIADLLPPLEDFGPGEHPFPTPYARRARTPRFNVAAYLRLLEAEFRERGGVVERAEFLEPAELLRLRETVVVQCTGYGARALFGDESLTPVRGQITWLPAEPALGYSLVWRDLNVVPRADGTVIQLGAQGDSLGWEDASEAPDAAEAERGVGMAAELFAGIRRLEATDEDVAERGSLGA